MINLAFIGAGNMATSLISGLLASGWPSDKIIATAKSKETQTNITKQFNLSEAICNQKAVSKADIVVICVKPNIVRQVLNEVLTQMTSHKLLISVAAGVTVECLELWTNKQIPIVRAMPNTPSQLRLGATGLFKNSWVNASQEDLAEKIFTSVGIVEWVSQEKLLNAVTAVSGSGPAYGFLLMEAMQKAAEDLGLDKRAAARLSQQTLLGAAQMAVSGNLSVSELRQKVTSKGGTTEQAINTFLTNNFYLIVKKAMVSAADKAQQLTKELLTNK